MLLMLKHVYDAKKKNECNNESEYSSNCVLHFVIHFKRIRANIEPVHVEAILYFHVTFNFL